MITLCSVYSIHGPNEYLISKSSCVIPPQPKQRSYTMNTQNKTLCSKSKIRFTPITKIRSYVSIFTISVSLGWKNLLCRGDNLLRCLTSSPTFSTIFETKNKIHTNISQSIILKNFYLEEIFLIFYPSMSLQHLIWSCSSVISPIHACNG